MSNIFVRNIVGTGVFQSPTIDSNIDSIDTAVNTILSGITGFAYLNAQSQIINAEGANQEIAVLISAFSLGGLINPDAASVRSAISSAFLADPDISSIGVIDIRNIPEGGFYNRYPEIDHIDDGIGYVYFKGPIPPGAQIEAWKYTKHFTGPHTGSLHPYTPRIGKRYRPDRLLAKGSLMLDLSTAFRVLRRSHFRFAYRWPVANNGTGAGVRGPLGPTTISTAVPWERGQGGLLVINPAPSNFGRPRPVNNN